MEILHALSANESKSAIFSFTTTTLDLWFHVWYEQILTTGKLENYLSAAILEMNWRLCKIRICGRECYLKNYVKSHYRSWNLQGWGLTGTSNSKGACAHKLLRAPIVRLQQRLWTGYQWFLQAQWKGHLQVILPILLNTCSKSYYQISCQMLAWSLNNSE